MNNSLLRTKNIKIGNLIADFDFQLKQSNGSKKMVSMQYNDRKYNGFVLKLKINNLQKLH